MSDNENNSNEEVTLEVDVGATTSALSNIANMTHQVVHSVAESMDVAAVADKVSSTQKREAVKSEREFQDSTHQYIIYFFEDWDFNALALGVFLYFFQYILYGIVWDEAMGMLEKDQLEVTISHSKCEAGDAIDGFPDSHSVNSDFQCEAGETPFQFFFLCSSLMAVYTQSDFAACAKVAYCGLKGPLSKICCFACRCLKCCCMKCCCCCPKNEDDKPAKPEQKVPFMTGLMALAVMSEGIMALCTGLLWAYVGTMKGSGYDALVMAIGILFVHDCDEQFYAATLPLIRHYNGPAKPEDEECCSWAAFKRKMGRVWFFLVGNMFALCCSIFFFIFTMLIYVMVQSYAENSRGDEIGTTAAPAPTQ